VEEMDVIRRMPLKHAQWIVTVRSLQQKIQYLFRCTGCGDRTKYINLAKRYDDAILSVLQRICHNKDLSQQAKQIAHLPQNMGGFGLKAWFDTADAAFLASYTFAATKVPILFPSLKNAFPKTSNSTTFVPRGKPGDYINVTTPTIPDQTTPENENEENYFPQTAINAKEACNRLALLTNQKSNDITANGSSLYKIQASIMKHGDTERLGRVITTLGESGDPRAVQHLARIKSAMGDIYTWSTTPSDAHTTLENHHIKIAALQRLLEPIIQTNNTEEFNKQCEITCPRCNKQNKTHPPTQKVEISGPEDIDAFGAHSIRCTAGGHAQRTKLWHDPLRDIWLKVFRHAGFTAVKEPTNVIRDSEKRPDVSVTLVDSLQLLHLDIRTCDPLTKQHVRKCSQQPGFAANAGAAEKDRAWLGFTAAQGDLFQAICHEHPGRIGEGALAALERAAAQFAQSEAQRTAFRVYWLQRLHITNTRGVADLIFHQMPYCNGNDVVSPLALPNPFAATLDMACPNPRATGVQIDPTLDPSL
jgi:hypothetical protein